MTSFVHIARRSVLEEEKHWSIEGDHLIVVSHSKREQMALVDVKSVHLEWSPSRADLSRFSCRVDNKDGQSFFIPSTHYRGFADFEDRAESYVRLVTTLVERIAIANPNCVLQSGSDVSRYILNILALATSATLLVGVLFLVGPVWMGLIGLFAIIRLLTLPWAIAWFRTNRPETMLLKDAVSSGLLARCLPSTTSAQP